MLHACQRSALVCATALCLVAPQTGWADGTTERVSVSSREAQGNDTSVGPTISGDGRFVGFVSSATNLVPGDTNGLVDIFLRDRQRGTTLRVSVGQNGEQQNAGNLAYALARNGRSVAFVSEATNLVPRDTNGTSDVFVRARRRGSAWAPMGRKRTATSASRRSRPTAGSSCSHRRRPTSSVAIRTAKIKCSYMIGGTAPRRSSAWGRAASWVTATALQR